MNKFEQKGIQFQQSSTTKEEALRNFAYSCDVCCSRGIRLDCERCGIAVCHKLTMAILGGGNNIKSKAIGGAI